MSTASAPDSRGNRTPRRRLTAAAPAPQPTGPTTAAPGSAPVHGRDGLADQAGQAVERRTGVEMGGVSGRTAAGLESRGHAEGGPEAPAQANAVPAPEVVSRPMAGLAGGPGPALRHGAVGVLAGPGRLVAAGVARIGRLGREGIGRGPELRRWTGVVPGPVFTRRRTPLISRRRIAGAVGRKARGRWVAVVAAPLIVVAAACGAAAPESGASGGSAETGKLVVWDWHSGDAKTKEYYAQAKADFESKHPGVQVEYVAQPYDQYYTLLGTAIQAGKGPDVAMFNGGAQMRERASSLLPLDDKTGDLKDRLVGWDAFKSAGTTYAVPITLQGFPFYYNKAVYKKAGLDPEAPPKTLAELEAGCAAIKKSGNACFNLGNKEGIGIEFFLSGFAPGVFSPAQYDAWLAGKRDWKSPEVRQIFDLWKKSNDEGWYNKGVNSTAMFMDQFTMFSGGKGGNVIGLISDTAHWKDFDEFLGPDLGVYKPPVLNPANASRTFLPAEGGIGYGVMKWTKSPDLAVDLIKSLAGTEAEKLFFDKAGAIAADKTVDTSSVDVKAAGDIVSWLPDSKPLLHTALSAKTLDLMHRLSQQLISGDVTVDAALTQLAASDK